jgi:murein L,D-transpeptidase YcbB/YkuD
MRGRAVLLAASCLAVLGQLAAVPASSGDEPQFLGRTRAQWVGQLESGDRRQLRHSAWAISQMAVEQANAETAMLWLNELCLLTEGSSSSVRYWGAIGLGRFIQKLGGQHPTSAKARQALAGLLKDHAAGPRLAAAEALCQTGDAERGLPALVAAMSHPQDAIRIQAVTALERLGEPARPALATLKAASTDSSEYVKRLAARALAKLEPTSK